MKITKSKLWGQNSGEVWENEPSLGVVEGNPGYLTTRPWHDARAIAQAHTATYANQEKGCLGEQQKARPKVKLRGLILPTSNSK